MMNGTAKQIKWANDIKLIAKKQSVVMPIYILAVERYPIENQDEVLEALKAIQKGFENFNDINDASTIISYGRDFRRINGVNTIEVFKVMAYIGGYKSLSNIEEYIKISKDAQSMMGASISQKLIKLNEGELM